MSGEKKKEEKRGSGPLAILSARLKGKERKSRDKKWGRERGEEKERGGGIDQDSHDLHNFLLAFGLWEKKAVGHGNRSDRGKKNRKTKEERWPNFCSYFSSS